MDCEVLTIHRQYGVHFESQRSCIISYSINFFSLSRCEPWTFRSWSSWHINVPSCFPSLWNWTCWIWSQSVKTFINWFSCVVAAKKLTGSSTSLMTCVSNPILISISNQIGSGSIVSCSENLRRDEYDARSSPCRPAWQSRSSCPAKQMMKQRINLLPSSESQPSVG